MSVLREKSDESFSSKYVGFGYVHKVETHDDL
jgi:hypothetical protein